MSMLYEIIELPSGEVVLKRVENDSSERLSDEPLVSIRFSDEAVFFLDDAKLDVAKAMIEAGLNIAENISLDSERGRVFSDEELLDDEGFDEELGEDPTVH